MSVILNIETSSEICSVAISIDGEIDYHIESDTPMQHAVLLAPYVEKAMAHLKRKELEPEAVAVSIGPGSYTGLRIGMSLAKGLCFAKNLPLIGINTLQLLAVKGMFALRESEGDEILVPMIDARRKEVYMAAYNFALQEIIPPRPMILEPDSLEKLNEERKLIINGNGSTKAKEIINAKDAIFLSGSMPVAMDMAPLSERAFRNGNFIDVAYSVPVYLKEYEAKKSENKVLHNISNGSNDKRS